MFLHRGEQTRTLTSSRLINRAGLYQLLNRSRREIEDEIDVVAASDLSIARTRAATAMGINQGDVSKIERRTDCYISTLRN